MSLGLRLALTCLALVAGCFSSTGDGTPAPTTTSAPPMFQDGDSTSVRTVAHDSQGHWLLDSAYPGKMPMFVQRYVGPVYEEAGEPTIGITPSGAAFYESINPGFKPNMWRSRDMGATWEKVTPTQAVVVDYPPATNDPFVYADPSTGRVFMLDLDLSVNCSTVQWSDDEGATWARSTTADCINSQDSHDHQSLAAAPPHAAQTNGYPNVVHYCVNRGEAWCYRSLDGGSTWLGPVETGLEYCGGLTGHVATAPNGDAFVGQISCGSQDGHDDEAWIASTRDDGQTWEPILILNGTVPVASQYVSVHEASIAVDADNNVYYMFLDEETMPRLVVSRDGGRTWGAPISLARPGITAATLPSIMAGDAGRIAFLYIGTTSPGGHSFTAATTWNAYVGFSLNATAADPVFATTTVNDLLDPLKRGDCSGRCHGAGQGFIPGGMYDFLDISMDPATGRIWTALVDVCNTGCTGEGGSETGQIGRPAVGVQTGGTTLLAGHDL